MRVFILILIVLAGCKTPKQGILLPMAGWNDTIMGLSATGYYIGNFPDSGFVFSDSLVFNGDGGESLLGGKGRTWLTIDIADTIEAFHCPLFPENWLEMEVEIDTLDHPDKDSTIPWAGSANRYGILTFGDPPTDSPAAYGQGGPSLLRVWRFNCTHIIDSIYELTMDTTNYPGTGNLIKIKKIPPPIKR